MSATEVCKRKPRRCDRTMFLTKADTKTVSVAPLSAYGSKEISRGTLGALAHFSTPPIVAVMILLNLHFVQGLTQGVH